MKVVINSELGGFYLPDEIEELLESKYPELYKQYKYNRNSSFVRSNPILVGIVENWMENNYTNLEIIEIPGGVKFVIFNYDGIETIVEVGHYWPRDEYLEE